MRKIKICEVIECGGPGGAGNQVAAICRTLDRKRFEVVLVYGCRSGEPRQYESSAGADRSFYFQEMVREISLVEDFKALWRLYRFFRSERPDVVHLHSSKAGFVGRIAARAAGVPKIFYSPRGYAFLMSDRLSLTRGFYWLLEKSVSWIGIIVAISEDEARLAERLSWGRPVRVIYDACLAPLQDTEKHEGLILGACGRLTAARDWKLFGDLVRRFSRDFPDFKAVWIGNGEDEPDFRWRMREMALEGSFELTGWLPLSDVYERMKKMDVFVHCSQWDGLPGVVLEAMASGLPAVVSDIPGCRNAIVKDETGYLAGDLDEFYERCRRLLKDAALRKRLGHAGQERVRRLFTPEHIIEQLETLYSE